MRLLTAEHSIIEVEEDIYELASQGDYLIKSFTAV